MELTKAEQETIILYDEELTTASVYTHDPKLILKLKGLADKYPDLIYPERPVHSGAVCYIVPKRCVCVREPYSAQRRRAQSARQKETGNKPPIYKGKK